MIIDCISDLHGYKPKLDGGDLLIVAGDLRASSSLEHRQFQIWLHDQDYEKKVIIAGSHDTHLANLPFSGIRKQYLEMGENYLCDSGTEFEGLKIWGSPWTKTFPGINPHFTAFTVDTDKELAKKWCLIPDDVDILVTRCPPYSILDGISLRYDGTFFHTGSKSLINTLHRVNPKLHVFGHIHQHGGQQLIYKRPGITTEHTTIMVNASIMDETYDPINETVRVTLCVKKRKELD